jgi:hypothetical protein
MYSSTAYIIRRATDADASTVLRLSSLDSQEPLTGDVLIGEIEGEPAAAISTESGRVVADPFMATAELAAHLRMRAGSTVAAERTPRLRDRIRAGIRLAPPASAWPRQTPISQFSRGT